MPYDLETMVESEGGAQPEDWASLQSRLWDEASGGRNDARTWSSGAPLLWRTGDGLPHPLAARRQITPESAYLEPELRPLASKYTRQLRARELEAAERPLEKTARDAAARHEAMEASKLERRAQEFAEQQRAMREQEDLYELLDAANRRQGLPVDEVVHDYVRPPVRKKNAYDGDPQNAQRLYGYYPPAD